MKKVNQFLLILIVIIFSSCAGIGNGKTDAPRAKNIILLIGDGMSDAYIYAAMTVQGTPLFMEEFPFAGFQKTNSLTHYITDSGASGTAIATGVKTRNGSIGVDTLGNHLESILMLAKRNGLATGVVSTSSITHATPAAFYANQPSRSLNEEIAYDLVKADVDVFIGGGYDDFAKRTDGLNLVDTLKAKGYIVTETMDELSKVASGKLAGFTASNHNPRYSEGRGEMLSDATSKAIELLSYNEKGFFLIVEGSMLDWAGHDNNIEYVVEETLDFDRAVGRALEFAREDGNTLVVVTSDHETGGLTLVGGSIENKTARPHFSTDGHTAGMVPILSYGPGAEKFSGILDNTDFFDRFVSLYGF